MNARLTPEYSWWWVAAGFDLREIRQPFLYPAGPKIAFVETEAFLRRVRGAGYG